MQPHHYVAIAVIVFFCTMIQATVGFAFGLFAIPLLLWMGLRLPETITISIMSTMVQGVFVAFKLRHDVPWPKVWAPMVMRLIGVPIGVMLLVLLVRDAQGYIKPVVGVMLLAALLAQWLWRVEPREHLHALWGWGCGLLSGVISGMVGMGGPPIVLWAMAHRWRSPTLRGVIMVIVLPTTPFQIALLWYQFGSSIPHAALVMLAVSPLAVAGSLIGLRISHYISTARLRKVVMGLLVIIALLSVIAPFV